MGVVQLKDYLDSRSIFYDWGRVIRDSSGIVMGVIEARDANHTQLALAEVNPSLYCFKAPWIWSALADLSTDNVQGEYLLTEVIPIARRQGLLVDSVNIVNPFETMGANTPEQLRTLETIFQHLADNQKINRI